MFVGLAIVFYFISMLVFMTKLREAIVLLYIALFDKSMIDDAKKKVSSVSDIAILLIAIAYTINIYTTSKFILLPVVLMTLLSIVATLYLILMSRDEKRFRQFIEKYGEVVGIVGHMEGQ